MVGQKFDFKDINLVPKKCEVESRSECDTSVLFGKYKFNLPIIPANMECIINEEMAIELSQGGYFYILHRFGIDVPKFVQTMKNNELISSISIGVNEDSYNILQDLKSMDLDPDYITIDIAHGHSIKMERMIKYIKDNFSSFIIAGNVSSSRGTIDLDEWGADAIKCGIAPGSVCTTAIATGFGSRNCQASMILNCVKSTTKPIIADGGIREPGDITKSLVLGAKMIMVGSMLSGFIDSPGNTIIIDNKEYKEFWGSASSFQSGKNSRIEGKKILVDFKNRYLVEELNYLKECLQSSISYGGGRDLSCLSDVNYF